MSVPPLSHTRRLTVLGLAAISALVLSGAAVIPASPAPTPSNTGSLYVGGFDRAVAEQNGYRIVEGANGTEMSVPITTATRRATDEVAQAIGGDGIMAAGTSCGTASLVIARGVGGKITIMTAYSTGTISDTW